MIKVFFHFLLNLFLWGVQTLLQSYRYFHNRYPLATPCFSLSFTLHLLLWLSTTLSWRESTPLQLKASGKIAIETYQLKALAPPPSPEKKTITLAPEVKKQPPVKLITPQSKPAKQKAPTQKKKEVASPKKETASSPSLEKQSHTEPNYPSELVSFLQDFLHLPQPGSVKLLLTLDRSGKVLEVKIISAQNSENRHYVNLHVPKVKFPPFGLSFFGQKNHTFLLNLQNEETL